MSLQGDPAMPKNDSVDVIIPTFNSTDYLGEAIESCLRQTYPVNKIIVVDDGSSVASQDYLRDLMKRQSKLHVIFNHHTGLPGIGRDLGIKASEAGWVAFLDSDDYWAPEKIAKQIDVAEKLNADVVYTNAHLINRDSTLELFHSSLPSSLTLWELLKTNWIVNSSVILRRSIFDDNFSYAISPRVRAVEDYATWLRLIVKFKFAGIAEPLTFYRDSNTSLRSLDSGDPRIHAISDFILWSAYFESQTGSPMKASIRKAFKVLKRQYLT
jgi:teichuronic acid biosynthesis glycosyltransferase TuaG